MCLRRRAYSIGTSEFRKVRTEIRGLLNRYAKRWRRAKRADPDFQVRLIDFEIINLFSSEKMRKISITRFRSGRTDVTSSAEAGLLQLAAEHSRPTEAARKSLRKTRRILK